MYKSSEQPASRIISEMPDFSFLNDTYVFTAWLAGYVSENTYKKFVTTYGEQLVA